MTPAISVAGLTRRYRGTLALDAVSFDIEPGSVTGLLGRNGAGKTTLLRIIAGQEFPSAGNVSVLGASPVDGDAMLHRMVFVREDQRYPEYGPPWGFTVQHALRAASWFYPDWDADLASALAADFGLPLNRRVMKLSRGMRSALGIVIGLAARAEVTLFDEPYAGLDPVARQLFYDRMLADYAEHPRTVLLSTHLIDEAAGLMERVLVIDHGKIVLDAAADEVRGSATSVSGPAIAVAEFTAGADGLGPAADRLAGVGGGGRGTGRHRPGPGMGAAPAPGAADLAAGRSARRQRDRGQPARDTHAGKDNGMNWSILVKVARFHLADRLSYTAVPWGVLAFVFAVWLALAASASGYNTQIPTGALATIYLFFLIMGMLSISRSLPFAFALGVSRRSYYAGTVLLAVALAAADGLALAVLQVIEQATSGWGVRLHFFRVAYILPGPWYLTWLTSFVVITLMFIYGMWFGLVYRRWNLLGAARLRRRAGHHRGRRSGSSPPRPTAGAAIGRFFTTLTAAGLTGLLAVLAVGLLAGGYATMRRVTV